MLFLSTTSSVAKTLGGWNGERHLTDVFINEIIQIQVNFITH
jgi:hypothetical protein